MAPEARGGLGAVVVGTGFGCLTHVRALRAAGFEVRALVGRDPQRTAERARRFAVPRACTSHPAPATFVDGVAGMAVLDAIRRSASEARWVDVDPRR